VAEQPENIKEIIIEEDMRDAYINFAMSVLIARALPDVRDGLKPSQRRILVAMHDLNLGPTAKFRKCAKITGQTVGDYHPHESSVYPTLVRLAQDFNMRYTLVDSQGNFGSIDGDPPAAMRYTEARLDHLAAEMLADIEKDTVDFMPTFDGSGVEPVVLPSAFPSMLCNGSSGIAVGMATSIPPHNLNEVVDALVRLIDDPNVSVDELIGIIQGPDFPTGAIICGREGIIQGYRTGLGRIRVRARIHFEEDKRGHRRLVATEIPYQVARSTIKERIAEAVQAGRIRGVSDLRDESDRSGQRLVIDLRKDADEQVVLNQLYKHSPLQHTFSINLIALVDNRPRTLNLKQMLACFRDHRIEVVRRRTAFLLRKAEDRAHILEGLLIALHNIDAIIALIKASPSTEAARDELRKRYDLSERQANAILQMQLQRLVNLERQKVEDEYRELIEKIAEYKAILDSDALVLQIIRDDLLEIKRKYGDARRTEIADAVDADFADEDLITEEMMAVTISEDGYIKRMPLKTYRSQGRGGKGITGAPTKEGDAVEHLFAASTHDYILFFTNKGRVYWLKVYDVPEMSRQSRGRALVNLISSQEGESVTAMIPVRQFDKRYVMMATRRGTIKKTPLEAFSRPKRGGIIAVKLEQDDELIGVALTDGSRDIMLGTRSGMATRFRESEARPMGRSSTGVIGIRLRETDQVVGMAVVEPDATLLTICENGHGKRTDFEEYSTKHRGTYGVINIQTTERNGGCVGMVAVHDEDEILMITANGMVIRTSMQEVRAMGRNVQGVRMIRLNEGDKLVSLARVLKEDAEADAAPAAGQPEAEPDAETDDLEADIAPPENEPDDDLGK
jgi:DNA gyrase subunit A